MQSLYYMTCMGYQEMQRAESQYLAAIGAGPKSKRQRGATNAQLVHRANTFGICPNCGRPLTSRAQPAACCSARS
jgi:hypothetical protein